MPVSPTVSVNIRNIAVGGAGVGEVCAQDNLNRDLLGITAFVPFTAVGERVSARVVQRKDRYIQAELIEVEQASVDRTPPECMVFGECGGCELQHMGYESQLGAKYEMVKGSLRSARLSAKALGRVRPVVPGSPYHYRRRANLHVDSSGRVGFYRSRSRLVVPIDRCPVVVPSINAVLPQLPDFAKSVKGIISSIQLEADEDGLVAVLNSPYQRTQVERDRVMKEAKTLFTNVCLLEGKKEVGGFGRQILEVPLTSRLKLRVPAGSFSQVNFKINQLLIERVIELAAVSDDTKVEELFSGAGNFSLPLAKAGANIRAVEVDPRLISLGRQNAEGYKLHSKLEFHGQSVEQYLKQTDYKPDIVIADPPRSGLGSLVPLCSRGEKFLLISCHLPSFVRDMKAFEDRGWTVETIEPFDMFAQTSYLEILGFLTR